MNDAMKLPAWVRPYRENRCAYRFMDENGIARIRAGFLYERDASRFTRIDMRSGLLGLALVLTGRGEYHRAGYSPIPIDPGCLLVRIPGISFSQIFTSQESVQCFLTLPPQLIPFLPGGARMSLAEHVYPDVIRPGWVREIRAIVNELETRPDDELFATISRMISCAGEILTTALRTGGEDTVIDQACRLLGGGVEWGLPLPEIARMCGVSYPTFRKLFKDRTGVSPGAYRIRKRIEAAMRLMQEGGHTPTATAEMLAYPDVFCLSKQFRQITGEAPRAWLRHVKEEDPLG